MQTADGDGDNVIDNDNDSDDNDGNDENNAGDLGLCETGRVVSEVLCRKLTAMVIMLMIMLAMIQ